MVKLPISDYVANYYKEQGIEFTLRQQAHICWFYNDLLKEQISSIKEILKISDDEQLNTEIRERIAYEEKAYECFMTGHEGCIYIVCPDDEDEYDKEYFAAGEKAVSYGIHHCVNRFKVVKSWLFDKIPKELSEEADDDDSENVNGILSWYRFTSEGNIIYGDSDEYKAPFDQEDNNRFENMFLNIKSPFGLGDIVMGPDFERPEVVTTDHDCFMRHYDRLKDHEYLQPDWSGNCIRTDCVGTNGNMYYDHTVPFHLWKIDSWEDKEYWELMKMMSTAAQKGIDLYSFDFMCHEYGKRNKEEKGE